MDINSCAREDVSGPPRYVRVVVSHWRQSSTKVVGSPELESECRFDLRSRGVLWPSVAGLEGAQGLDVDTGLPGERGGTEVFRRSELRERRSDVALDLAVFHAAKCDQENEGTASGAPRWSDRRQAGKHASNYQVVTCFDLRKHQQSIMFPSFPPCSSPVFLYCLPYGKGTRSKTGEHPLRGVRLGARRRNPPDPP